VKTPSFSELKTIVEYINEELEKAQLQEILSTEKGLVLGFYRFTKTPKMMYLLFDLDPAFPFVGLLEHNPWLKFKKTKPTSLFLSAHAKNQLFDCAEVNADLGRVVRVHLGAENDRTTVEFRAIPKQVNLIVEHLKKSISWSPVKELATNTPQEQDEEVRSISFLTAQWKRLRLGEKGTAGTAATATPFDKWIKNREKDFEKKSKALAAVQTQLQQFHTEEWAEVGEYLKTHGFKNLKPEWSVYVNFEKSVSENIQHCFEKAKSAKTKAVGAQVRIESLKQELEELKDHTQEKFEKSLQLKQKTLEKKKAGRKVEGKLRKLEIPGKEIVAYMGKSAADNMNLLRNSRPHDLWVHLKDYPSAHAIVHLQKSQNISDSDLVLVGKWLVEEGISKSQTSMGGKYAVVSVECRHVKPLKGDKMGRVTYHNAREFLIAL
jgi:hypothetical protein